MKRNRDGFQNANVGLEHTDLAGFEEKVPETLKFTRSKQGLAARRIPIKIRAELQQYSTDKNKQMRFLIPNGTLLDFRKGYLQFDVTLAKTGGTYIRVHEGIFSLFDRLRILANTSQCSDVRDWNRIYNALWQMIQPAIVTQNIGVGLMGFGTQATRNAQGAITVTYICPIWSGLLNTELLPLDNINGGLQLELYLGDPTTTIETDGTTPIVTISNPVLHCERLELDVNYRRGMADYVRANGLQLGFHTWDRYINQLTGGTQQNVNIQHRSSSLNAMLNIFVNAQELNNPAVNDKFIKWPTLNFASNQVINNSQTFPDEPMDGTYAGFGEIYQMYCRWIMKWSLNGILTDAPPISWASFGGNAPIPAADAQFVQIDDFEAYPEEMDLINPYTTMANNTTIMKKMNFSAPIPLNTYQLDTWAEFFQQATILSNGKVELLQ